MHVRAMAPLSEKSLSLSSLASLFSLPLSLSHPLSLSKTSLSLSPVCVAVNRPLLSASHCCFSLQLARTAYAKRRRDWSLAAARTWPWDGHGLMSHGPGLMGHGPHGSGSIDVLCRRPRPRRACRCCCERRANGKGERESMACRPDR